MRTFTITSLPGFDEWREAARFCLSQNLLPEEVFWQVGEITQNSLFEEQQETVTPFHTQSAFKVPPQFIALARLAACHNDPERFGLLYRLLWRLRDEGPSLLGRMTDPDIYRLTALIKAVRRDAYKITAFLRFRETAHDGAPHYIAWYEPEHYSLELKLDFFKTRFKNMRWSILTPYRAAHWNGEALFMEDNPCPDQVPKDDAVEDYWLTYYASIFNPARVKKQAMMSQMPKKYWKNMPETKLIGDLLEGAQARVQTMLEKSKA